MRPLFNRYLLLCLAALLIVTAFVGCRQTPGGTDGTEGSDDVTSDVVEEPTAPVTDPDVESEESDTATETSGETDEETDNGDETPGEILWEPDVLAWYDVDHGSSVNSRPDHGWDPLYQQSPGLVTQGGIFRSATPLLGTYDQIDPAVAKQHLYWLGAAGFDAVVVDITNYNARETGEDFQRYMRGLINNTKVLLQAAKDMAAEGHTNVPQVVIAPRLFGTDFEALDEILEKIYQLQSEYPEQVYRMAEESKPLVLVFCDWAVFDQWGFRPPEDVDDRMDIRFCNGYLDRYGVFNKETGGWAISNKRNMFLFVENKKGETEGSYAPIYTVGKDGKPEVMCSSVSVHGGWSSDGSNWDAMNNLIGGKTPLERTLEPVYAIRPDVVIVNRFNYPLAWMEQPQEGLGLYHSGHFEPCEELGFEMYDHVQKQIYDLKSLKGTAPAKPAVVSDASNRLLLALDGNPMEYRISESESFEGAEWRYYNISEGVDYSYLASLDQIWVQTRNSFGESEAVLVDVNGEFTGDAGSYTVEFNQVSFSPAPAWQENPFSHTALPAEVTNGTAAYIMMPKDSSVGFTVKIGAAGTYRLILRCVTDNQGPTIRFAVDGVDTRNKVCMANGGKGWTYTEFDLGLVTMTAGMHEITITALDQSNQAFVLDNLYIRPAEEGETDPEPEPEETEPEETEPPIDADYIFELDELTFDPAPAWSEIPYSHVFLPAEVSDGRTANLSLNLDQETGVTLKVDKAGTYLLTLNVVTNTNGPVLQVFVDGQPIGEKVVMSNTAGAWRYESLDLAVVTLEAGDHVLSFRSVDVASDASFILDNVYLNEVDPAETDEPTTDEPTTDEPTTDEPTTDEPTTDEPTTDEPTTDEPTTDEPTPDEPTPEPPQELIFEFDSLTYNPMPHWHEIPYTHGALPDGVTDKRTANMSLNLGEEVSVTLTVEKAGTYLLVLNAVTNTNGPILQFAVNGQDVGGKVKMAYGGQWGYATFNLGYVTLNAGENTLSFRSVDVASDASFMLDNLVLTPVDMDAAAEFSYEFDEMTFVTYPSWMDKSFVNGALPADVTDGKAIFATIRKDAETVMTFSVPVDGTCSIIFKGVTDNNGPTLQFFVDGNAIGGKVNMANGGSGWTFTSFDLGKLTLTVGVHTLTIRGVDVDSESPCVMDRLVLVPTEPDEPTPEPPQELIFEFDTLTYNPMPHWHEIPYTHGALPEGVTDKRTANMSLNLGEEVSVTLTVEKAGTYALVLHAVTNTNGPILQFAVNGQDVGGKVKMAYGGQWGYATFNLGYVTLNAGENTLSFRSVDVASDASFMLDNLVLTSVDMDAATEFSYEFDEMTFVTYPSWMDKSFVNGALPADVTDGKAIFATIRKDAETVMTFSVPVDGTYSIIFKGVTDNNGPTLQFFVDGNAIGGKVNMANGGSGWTFTSFDLGKLTLTAGVHTLTIRGVDVDSESPCVMDRLVLVPTNP